MFVTAVVHEEPTPSAPASVGGCVVSGTVHVSSYVCECQHAGYLRGLHVFQGIMNGYKKIILFTFCINLNSMIYSVLVGN